MATSRISISNKFENGDIPSQSDFGEIFDSFVHKDEDKANFQMVETGTDDQHYVTPALLKIGLQNIGIITGNCYLPNKEYFNNFNGTTIFLKKSPINFSVQAFKNGQLLLEKEDYTINYATAVITFSATVPIRNIEIDYWYKNTGPIPGNTDITNVAGKPYIGEIKCLASPTGPKGWLKCEGQELLISEYSQLFSVIGVTYGGNGTTHFKTPNLSGRSIVQPTTNIVLGSVGGSEATVLTENNLPAHTHGVGSLAVAINCSNLNADESAPQESILAVSKDSYCQAITTPDATLAASATSITGVTASVGSAQPIITRSPYLAMYYYISSYGESPLI
ncbi:tail fiber protein [Flavobacterium sp. LS1R49]|uniref:Tail fiber protein n=1 Tax=Flavobacterium shii TaxID=2987687 RepID=A0A9X2ZBT1_9FLAO|nr:tail fiber protein [Flavobacterium shii]MCV9928119.1 tail fiber protein [Flavobacterium shii]